MPKLYFCRSDNQSQGMLRAVLPWEECIRVLDLDSATYVGSQFPNGSIGPSQAPEVAIFCVLPEEASEDWCAGYYRFDTDVMEINVALQTLAEVPQTAPSPAKSMPETESRPPQSSSGSSLALRLPALRIAASSE